MSRLTELIAKTKAKDPQLAADLQREFKALSSRLSFGLNFERHRPEAVELPQRPVRRGDKVRILPERGSTKKGDQSLWRVTKLVKDRQGKQAGLERLDDPEQCTTASVDDVVVVAEFRDTIYPGLVSTGKVTRGDDKPCHTVINGENYHVLKALTWTHRGNVDAIYIDPPYNTGAKDWKYNNDYVEEEDLYRHSKWLAMMERRLLVAKELLNPEDSVLIVTIDEKEYLRLGLLLEQIYPEARIQMVSSLINPASMPRHSTFGRIDEYIFYVFLGSSAPVRMQLDEEWVSSRGRTFTGKIRWDLILQSGPASQREDSPAGFYPVYIDPDGPKIAHVGEALPLGESRESVANETEWHALWPIRKNGTEGRWRLGSETLRERLALGHVRVGGNEKRGFTLYYLTPAEVAKIEDGTYKVIGRRPDGSPVTSESESRPSSVPTTQWRISSHDATQYGSRLLAKIMPDRKFPYPKSLYAVEDSLRFIVADKPDAIILDFFAGSGTTAHAVMRLNERDGGRRQCISVTNNEVAADEHKTLREAGLRPGDAEWEKLGICDYITKPRVKSAITGITPDGEPIDGEYKFGNRSEVEKPRRFYHIAFADHNSLKKTAAKRQLVSLIDDLPQSLVSKIESYIVSDKYDAAVLFDPQEKERWLYALEGQNHIRDIYIVTPDVAQFKDLRDEVSDLLGPIVVSEEHEVPMAQGFEENAEFFTLTYETPVGVNYQTAFARIAPLLWLRAGSVGQRIDKLPAAGWGVEDAYGLLIDLDKGTEFLRAIRKADNLRIVYIVTDDERRFQSLSRRLPDGVEAIRLYESYLSNFAFANGDEA